MFTRPLEPCWNTMQAAPVRSSSITASLTESRFSDVVASAMMTGLYSVTSSSPSAGASMT